MSDDAHPKRRSPAPPPPRPTFETPPARRLVIAELRALQDTRYVLARGGKPPVGERTPEDCARIASFFAISLLLRILLRFKQKIEGGERCRLVEREHAHEPDRIVIELEIEPVVEESGDAREAVPIRRLP